MKKPYRVRIHETRCFEFEVWAEDAEQAQSDGQRIWSRADTTGQWETDSIETEYSVDEITHEPGALPVAQAAALSAADGAKP